MNSETIYVAHSIYSNKGVFCLLLGSGVSRPSGILTGWEVTLELIKKIALIHKQQAAPDLEKWFEDYFKEVPGYSEILEKLTSSPEERINLLRPYFEPTDEELEHGVKAPTAAHRAIASLIKAGYIRVVVTTNFDRLLENALGELGIQPTVISNPSHVENTMPLIHSRVTIIKINGDYLDTGFLNITSELNKYDPRIEKLLLDVFENFGIITAGWSAKWDSGLISLLKSANKFRFGSYFSHVSEPGKELKDISDFRHGKLIKIGDADSFFTEINEIVGALEQNEVHPLTKDVALARLKKYVAREDLRVQLYDFFHSQIDETFRKLDKLIVSANSMPHIKSILDFYLRECDFLIHLMAQGIYWGKDYHFDTWTTGIQKVATIGSNIPWQKFRLLPALLIFYAAGLTALIRRDFKFLQYLFLLKRHEDQSRRHIPFIEDVCTDIVMHHKTLNQALGKSDLVPMSEILWSSLKDKFSTFLFSQIDYDNLFDYFEIIFALYYQLLIEKGRFPVGRFLYRRDADNVLQTKFNELVKEGSEFELVKSGLFPDVEELKLLYEILLTRSEKVYASRLYS